MLRDTTLCAVVVAMLAMGATYAQGRGGGGACGDWTGKAWGLCNAYCEAKSCYLEENKYSRSCTQIYSNFSRITGSSEMPCGNTAQAAPPVTAGCPCDFDIESWTSQPQILDRSDPLCTADFNNCITCNINLFSASTTFLSIVVNLWGSSPQEDKLLFFADPQEGTCVSDGSFNSGTPITTEGGQLTLEQFSACVSDIGALKRAYEDVNMCGR